VQVGLPCPPPATVGGLLAAAAGGWRRVPAELRFAMAFSAAGRGVDLETYHPLSSSATRPVPKDREFLAAVELRVWLLEGRAGWELARWEQALRRPVWPLRLGRSQDLATARTRRIRLAGGPGRQGFAVVPDAVAPKEVTSSGTLLQLPTAISLDRARTRWDAYRYHTAGSHTELHTDLCTPEGQAVVLLPPTHPDQFLTEASGGPA